VENIARREETRDAHKILVGKREGKRLLVSICRNKKIMLSLMLKKFVVQLRTAFNWQFIRFSSGIL